MDEGSTVHMAEGSTVRMDLSPVAPSVDRNATFSEEQEHPVLLLDEEMPLAVKKRDRRGGALERLTKSLHTNVAIQIPEGLKRPENPLQAALFASEGGFLARKHTPVLPHFKEYKKDKTLMNDFVGKVAASFRMDTEAEVVQKSCIAMLQKITKNIRHLIKKEHFDKVPANEVSIKSPVPDVTDGEWQDLVKMWSTPKHKKTCLSNQKNQKKVVFQQKTGSRSYAAHIYSKREERQGEELTAIDFFKTTQHSKKDGYSEAARKAIAEMEKRKDAPTLEGQEPKSAAEIVEEVLKTEVKQSTFLFNVGLKSSSTKSKATTAVVAAHVQDLEEKLERSEMHAQVMREEMAIMKKRSDEAEAAAAARDRDYDLLFQKSKEQDEKYANLLALLGVRPTGS